MNYLNDVVLGNIFLLFPIMCYLFYLAYNKNVSKEENNFFLCFALFSSIYLILGKDFLNFPRLAFFLADIVIIIAYIIKRPSEALLLSLFYIIIVYSKYNLNIYILILEYILYFIIYKMFSNKNKYYFFLFYIIKIIAITNLNCNIYIDNIYSTIFISCVSLLLVIYFVTKGDSIIKYHLAYKELMEDKQIRNSLFKISHEIKNPLFVCKGYFDIMDLDNVEKSKKYMRIIRDEINHALLILNDFSNLSKITVEKELVDVDLILDDTINSLKELFSKNDINIVYNGDEAIINGDYKRLMQVFINILKNSIEALENRENKKINVELMDNEKYIEIVFKDNGIGMDNETISKFMEPFYTTKINGTGLGTVLSSEIIKAHNGTIKYKSKLNFGTEVYITIKK